MSQSLLSGPSSSENPTPSKLPKLPYADDEKEALLKMWRAKKWPINHAERRTPSDALDWAAARQWFIRKYTDLSGVDERRRVLGLPPKPASSAELSSSDAIKQARKAQRDAFLGAMRKANANLPFGDFRDRMEGLVEEKEGFFKSESETRKQATKKRESYPELPNAQDEIMSNWKSDRQEFTNVVHKLFRPLFYAQVHRHWQRKPHEARALTTNIISQLLQSFEFELKSTTFKSSYKANERTQHFICATPRLTEDPVLVDALFKIGLPGSEVFDVKDAFYSFQNVSFAVDGEEEISNICELSKSDNPLNRYLTTFLSGSTERIRRGGCLWNLYFLDCNPAPLLIYCQPPVGVASPTMSHSIAKVITGGAAGWRRYKTWRALIRSRVTRAPTGTFELLHKCHKHSLLTTFPTLIALLYLEYFPTQLRTQARLPLSRCLRLPSHQLFYDCVDKMIPFFQHLLPPKSLWSPSTLSESRMSAK